MISSFFGVLLPIIPWNYGVFLAANTYRNPGNFRGVFMALGSEDAHLLGALFTGYFEAFVQLTVPWLFSVFDDKAALVGTKDMFKHMSWYGAVLFWLNWTFNGIGGAMWQFVYYLSAVNMVDNNDPDRWPVMLVEFSTAGTCGSISPCHVGVWACVLLAFLVAFSVLLCNILCPPLMHFFVSDKKHRLAIRRWMRAARHNLLDIYSKKALSNDEKALNGGVFITSSAQSVHAGL